MINNLQKADEYNKQGIELVDRGKIEDAINCFKKAFSVIPNASSSYFLGLSYQMQNNLIEAEKNYLQTIKFAPDFSMAYNNLGAIYLERKDYFKAIQQFNSAISSDPKNASFYNNLGNAYRFTGRIEEAIEQYKKAVVFNPSMVDTFNNLGLIFFEQEKFEKSILYLQKAIEIDSAFVPAYFHLAVIFIKQNMPESAIPFLETCIRLSPEKHEAYALLATIYSNMGFFEKSLDNFNKALKLVPDSAYIMNDLGNLYKQFGDLDKALDCYKKALTYDSSLAGIINNIGLVYLNRGESHKAENMFTKALKEDPNLATAHYHLGLVYDRQGKLDKAVKHLTFALENNPELALALSVLVYVLMKMCDWKKCKNIVPKLNSITSSEIKTGKKITETPFVNVVRTDDQKINYLVAKSKSNQIKTAVSGNRVNFSFTKSKNRGIINIGYLSHDFYDHPTAYLTSSLYKAHNRERFKIFAYSYGPNDSSYYRKKMERDFDVFRDIAGFGFRESANLIYKDNIDILVDLKGYTRDTRLEICALRPSPVQVTWLGFPGTTGADFIDYIITDRVVTPPEVSSYYSEKFVYMPDCYQINDNQRITWMGEYTKYDFNIPQDAFVYSSFNTSYKIDYQTIQSWMRILQSVPNSVLWLFASNKFTLKNIKKEALVYNVNPKRIIFSKNLAQVKHIKRLALSDLALDTFLYNGHTTTSDALWAGVPVIALQGNHFASRVSSSVLTAVGLPELITHTQKDYEKLAISLAKNPKKLNAIRSKLNANKFTQPLFDTPLFVKNLEKAFEKMWLSYLSGQKPSQIII